jgi:predicted Zn-dependent peptidase
MPYTQFTLSNGLMVVVQEDHASPFVAVDLWYHAGSAQDPGNRRGLAHFVEHLMFDGGAHTKANAHFELLAAAGAYDVNATTNADRTNYFETVPTGALSLALWLEAERMGFLRDHIDKAQFERERSVVKNELFQRFDNVPNGWVDKYVQEAVFPKDHPYGHLTIGEVADLDATTTEDARAYMRRYYVPNNASLVLVGDVSSKDARALLETYFGDIPAGAPVPLPTPDVPVLGHEKRLVVESDIERPELWVSWPLPPVHAPGMNELAVGADGIAAFDDDERTDTRRVMVDARERASRITLRMTLGEGISPSAALSDLDDHLHKMRSTKWRFDRTKLAISRAPMLSRFVYQLNAFSSRADSLSEGLWTADDPAYSNVLLGKYQWVTVEDVGDAYYQFLNFDNRVVATVLPRKGAPRAGRLVEGGP